MHPTPSRTRAVTPARAERSVTDSRRGLASRLSPTQTVSKAPEVSASTVRSIRSRTETLPSTTARLVRMRPKDGRATSVLPVYLRDEQPSAQMLARPIYARTSRVVRPPHPTLSPSAGERVRQQPPSPREGEGRGEGTPDGSRMSQINTPPGDTGPLRMPAPGSSVVVAGNAARSTKPAITTLPVGHRAVPAASRAPTGWTPSRAAEAGVIRRAARLSGGDCPRECR